MSDDPRVENPRKCGVTKRTGNTEWVCVADPHDTEKQRSNRRDARGNWPRHLRHYFVNHHPWRTP